MTDSLGSGELFANPERKRTRLFTDKSLLSQTTRPRSQSGTIRTRWKKSDFANDIFVRRRLLCAFAAVTRVVAFKLATAIEFMPTRDALFTAFVRFPTAEGTTPFVGRSLLTSSDAHLSRLFTSNGTDIFSFPTPQEVYFGRGTL